MVFKKPQLINRPAPREAVFYFFNIPHIRTNKRIVMMGGFLFFAPVYIIDLDFLRTLTYYGRRNGLVEEPKNARGKFGQKGTFSYPVY